MPETLPDVEDAAQYILGYLRSGRTSDGGTYGYQIYLHHLVLDYLKDSGVPRHDVQQVLARRDAELSRAFYAAAWELCRRGILRPGLRTFRGQATDAGGSGHGYSLTPFGESWLKAPSTEYVPVEPGRLVKMFAEVGRRMGPGFVERAEQAVASYNARAFLACCAMCGAAAESVILAVTVAKSGDEVKTLNTYATGSGRGRIEAQVLKGQPEPAQEEFRRYTALLKYWRDSSSHGRAVRISEPEAYQSLVLLLRFARWAEDHWDELTRRGQTASRE